MLDGVCNFKKLIVAQIFTENNRRYFEGGNYVLASIQPVPLGSSSTATDGDV